MSQIVKTLYILSMYLMLCRGEINLTVYKQMPELYKYDDFRECLSDDKSQYCMALVQIQPDLESSVWQQIEAMNFDKFNYRHDMLFRGLCMKRCKDLQKNGDPTVNVNDSGLLINEQTQMFQNFYNTTLDRFMRSNYQQIIHECINSEYLENYNLSTKTFVSFCVDSQSRKETDINFDLSILLFVFFILLNILSTLYDAKLKSYLEKPDDKINYYEVKHNDKVNRYLTAFSLYRNYKRLVASNKSDIGIDLSFLDGFRAILCLLIVQEHAFLVQFAQSSNPEFIENLWHELTPRIIMHSLIWLELFFVLSGLLLYVKFEKTQYITPKSSFFDCVNVFVRLTVSRYLRYLPSLLILIIFAANVTGYHGQNEIGRNFMDANCLACRESWWLNVLMVNNFFMKNSCMMHTWYIAADFQLYCLFLLILIITSKFPDSKALIFTSLAILAAGVNFGVNYILKLDSVLMFLPESYRYQYFNDIKTLRHSYFSTYTNIHSFLLGIICGFIYMKYLRKNPENKNRLGNIIQNFTYIGWMCILCILYLGTTIMDHKETTIWTAAYGLLHRHVGLAIVAVVVILRGMCLGGGFLEWPVFRFLARISFQVYLWQIVIFLNAVVHFNRPLIYSYGLLYMVGVFLYIASSIIGIVIALFVEYPIAEVITIIDIEKNIKPKKTS